jgi:hypothetical protein
VFSGFNATVLAAMPDKNRAELMLEFLGRKSKIELDYDALQNFRVDVTGANQIVRGLTPAVSPGGFCLPADIQIRRRGLYSACV